MDLTPYLNDLEARIDPAEEDALAASWLGFADKKFTGNCFIPLRKASAPGIDWPHVMINDAVNDLDLMVLGQLEICSNSLRSGTGELLSVRPNYGCGIIPSVLGAELFVMPYETDTLPATRPLRGGRDDLLRFIEADRPDFSSGLAGKSFAFGERFMELTRDYPKIRQYVHIYNPDLQGPFPLVESLWGSDVYMDLLDEPDDVLLVLSYLTDLYIRLLRKWKETYPDFDDTHAIEWGLLHKGATVLRNDAVMNLSGDMYSELIRPFDAKIFAEFGGIMHFCGRGHHYIEEASEIEGLYGFNLSQPDWNDMEIIYRNSVDKGLEIIGMPAYEVERAMKEGRPLRGLVHCGASLASWSAEMNIKKDGKK